MKIHYRAEKRKHLAQCVSEFVGTPAVYMRMPTYAYKAGDFTIDFEGNLLSLRITWMGNMLKSSSLFLKRRDLYRHRRGRKRVNPPKPKNEPKRMKQANRRNLWG